MATYNEVNIYSLDVFNLEVYFYKKKRLLGNNLGKALLS